MKRTMTFFAALAVGSAGFGQGPPIRVIVAEAPVAAGVVAAADEPRFPLLKPAAERQQRSPGVLQVAPLSEPGVLDTLGEIFDLPEDDVRPWSTTTTVRLQAKQGEGVGQLVPFFSVAHEVGALGDRERLGVGGGSAYYFTRAMSVGTELLYFNSDGGSTNTWERETRLSLQFRFDF